MNKHLQQKQLYDSFFDENYDQLQGDEPLYDPEVVDEQKIYDSINEDEFVGNLDELNLDEDEEILFI
jgi:hypothetical protein